MRADVWQPYSPDDAAPWDLRRVVHLHRRAGFAATWDELQRDLREGPRASIDRLLEGAAGAGPTEDGAEFGGWWLHQMLYGPDPLGEKLTLLWHGTFAGGGAKVPDPAAVRFRIETNRKLARGRLGALLGDAARDPATARRVAGCLCDQFFGERGISEGAVSTLGDELHGRQLDVGWAVETVLRSKLFFAERNIHTRVLSPVEFVTGTARALELFDPTADLAVLADWCGRLGQNLFEPPDGGWPGGRAWINPRTMIARAAFVKSQFDGAPGSGRAGPFDPTALAGKYGATAEDAGVFCFRLLQGMEPLGSWRDRLATDARRAVAMLLSTPEGQLA
jgi:uncharacterized protein (DUF1800 family)